MISPTGRLTRRPNMQRIVSDVDAEKLVAEFRSIYNGQVHGLWNAQTESTARLCTVIVRPEPGQPSKATYIGPKVHLYGRSALVLVDRRPRRNRIKAQFDGLDLMECFGWHEFPRCHWRFPCKKEIRP